MRRSDRVIEPLSVVQASAIEIGSGPSWLVDGLWPNEGVGCLGGMPKSCKSWLALDLAVSVASGTAALGTYAVPSAGPVLVLAAEDPPATVRSRLDGLAVARGVSLESLPLHVVVEASVRLDTLIDQQRLAATVEQHRPRLLILDPFVRLHRIDENSALEVSGVLAYLREVQRRHHVAVLVVHHSRKAQGGEQAGLSLRGSGDFHAWGDSNLFMRRRRGGLELAIEHRSAASPEPVPLALELEAGPPHLIVSTPAPTVPASDELKARTTKELAESGLPKTQEALRSRLGVRLSRLTAVLRELEREGCVSRTSAGWVLTAKAQHKPGETELGTAGTQPSKG